MAFVKTTIETDNADKSDFTFSTANVDDFIICKGPQKLQLLFESIERVQNLHYISDGDWSMHDLVMMLLKKYKPAHLFITTYALRETPVRQIIMAQERKEILSVNLLLDYRAKTRTPEVFQLASMNMNKIFLTNVHAKVTVLRSAAGCITIVGSANWTQNPRIEAGVISKEKSCADFHINWIEKTMDNAEVFS